MEQILKELNDFTGTEQYHKINILTDFVLTDGCFYLMNKLKCYWLFSDIGILLKCEKNLNKPFLILNIKVNKDKSALITLKEDSDLKPVYSKKISYTDFDLNEYELYIIDKVFLLKSEY